MSKHKKKEPPAAAYTAHKRWSQERQAQFQEMISDVAEGNGLRWNRSDLAECIAYQHAILTECIEIFASQRCHVLTHLKHVVHMLTH